jgi:hypothetical protein
MAKRKPDNIDKDLAMAEKLGYGPHYGAYKADYPNTREPEPEIVPVTPDKDVYDAVCPVCGKTFAKVHGLQMYCCQRCKDDARRRMNRDRYARIMGAISNRICPTCKREFLPVHRSQKYCCDECQRKRKQSA